MNVRNICRTFKRAAKEAYSVDDSGTLIYSPAIFREPKWQHPWKCVTESAAELERVAASDLLSNLRLPFQEFVEIFLDTTKSEALSYFAHGDQALVFEIKPASSCASRVILRIGPTKRIFGDERFWCPAVIQPHHANKNEFISLEYMPLISAIDEDIEFAALMNQKAFKDTPFRTNCGKDLGVLPGGTPLFIDPGDVMLWRRKKPFSNEEKQKIMAIMYHNCCDLPDPLQWVIALPSGDFKTKQDVVFPNPMRPLDCLQQDVSSAIPT